MKNAGFSHRPCNRCADDCDDDWNPALVDEWRQILLHDRHQFTQPPQSNAKLWPIQALSCVSRQLQTLLLHSRNNEIKAATRAPLLLSQAIEIKGRKGGLTGRSGYNFMAEYSAPNGAAAGMLAQEV
jgi:hypothetical protein